jgi:hypothetical protein
MELVGKFRELELRFKKAFARMSNEEIAELDRRFTEGAGTLLQFYGISMELKTSMERQRFIDYLYMYSIVYKKTVFDERYDQIIFSNALNYAKLPKKR